jgi:pimeloyl-ACP methyl ester carboxylesterase
LLGVLTPLNSITHHPEQLVSANNLHINYDSFGDKSHPAIVLIMGLATQMIYWDEQFCKLLASQGYWVIRFDNRDNGKSTWLDSIPPPTSLALLTNAVFKRPLGATYLLSDMMQDTVGLLDALQLESAHIVGASMGGMIAQEIAIHHPHRVKSLTSIMSTTGNRKLPKPSAAFSFKMLKPPPKDVDKAVTYGMHVWRMIQGNYYPFDQPKVLGLITRALQRGFNPSGNTRQLAAILDSPDRTEALNTLTVPSLILHGEADPLVLVACGYATAKAIPNAKIKTYPGMGHTIPSQLYADITEQILDHIKAS